MPMNTTMASITTQNVAAAVATVVQPSPSAHLRPGGSAMQPAQVAQASQVAAQQQSHVSKRKDDARSTQIPKRAEGSFSAQRESPRRVPAKRAEEQEEEPTQKKLGMDVVA